MRDLWHQRMIKKLFNGMIFATLKVNELALLYWAMQYGEVVEIVAPEETRQKYKDMLNKIIAKY